ncbi:MAG TPA: hypothetical protein ACFYD2_00580 [Candidatus Avalokitesvara rifleensis]|uniref:hypothetical protein n=1 Tax=Candidatus Avalokitesvara rifleensis TaxID=3367620 RepID=UPI0027129CD7|nr:hypothetical protein [Candidatus Brocadiales bacterium]
MAFCKNIQLLKDRVDVSLSSKCRYHPPFHFKVNELAPDGLCPEAFHSLHPICFQIMLTPYAKYLKEGVSYWCPGESVRFRAYRVWNTLLRYVPINILHGLIGLFKPTEMFLYRVFVKIEEISGNCPYEYKAGQSFEYNIGHRSALCPAGYYSTFPYLAGKLYGVDNGAGGNAYQCPDHVARVKYSLQDVTGDKGLEPICCRNFWGIRISVNKEDGSGDIIDTGSLKDSEHLPCLSLLHSLYPYYLTLVHGGRLGFFTNDYNSALVSCPSPETKVVARIARLQDNGTIMVKIDIIEGICPQKLRPGTIYNLTLQNESSALEILSNVHPYLVNARKLPDKTIKYSQKAGIF